MPSHAGLTTITLRVYNAHMNIAPSSQTPPHPVQYLTIAPEHAGQRIDNFLMAFLKGVPREYVYRILRSGEVRVNKGRAKPVYRVQVGDVVRIPPVRLPQPGEVPKPTAGALAVLEQAIVYQDKFLLVLNKPAGMAVHGGSGLHYGVIEGLRVLLPREPHLELAHRLDRETSGCLLVAKKNSMLRYLHDQLRTRQVEKTYLALVRGAWPAGVKTIHAPLQKNVLASGERMVRVHPQGKPSETRFVRQEAFACATLMRAHPVSGRTHQIRVHATHAGHPIAGDSKYGTEAFNQTMAEFNLNRLFLHAESITLHGESESPGHFSVPLPDNLASVLERLRLAREPGQSH